MYNFWFVLLVGGLCLAFCAFDVAYSRRKKANQPKPCSNSCLKGCKYMYTRDSLEIVCRSLNCTCIPDGIPRNVTKLSFTGHSLQKLNADTLGKLTELTELKLRANKIRSFTADTFKGQVKLRRLDLSGNQHVLFPHLLFQPLKNLEELHLDKTMRILQFKPDWLRNLTQLRYLSYAKNQLFRIPIFTRREFSGTKFRYDRLMTPNLKELHLEDNNIRQIYARELNGLNSLVGLYLCRNFIGFIENGAFSSLKKLRYLHLDGSRLVRIEQQSLLSSSVEYLNLANTGLFWGQQHSFNNPLNINNSILHLDLSGTNLNTHLFNGFVKYFGALRSLNVNQNNLEILTSETFQKLSSLKDLRVANNALTQVSDSSLPPKLWSQLETLDLSGNPFRCDCKLIEFCQWIKSKNFSYSEKLLNNMKCVINENKKSFPVLRVRNRVKMGECLVEENDWFLRASTAAAFIISFLSTFVSTLHRFRWNIRYWYFTHKIKTRRFKQVQDKKHYAYDAFISYSETDSRWVIRQLLPRLESEYHLRLCIHHRDWLAGRDIAENIVQSIEQSRKTVLIVSNAFAVSQWCHFEMTMAQSRVFQDDRDNLILVMMEEIADCNMTPRLRMLTERQTYVQWVDHGLGQQLFWVKLGQALEKPAPSVTDSLPPLNVFIA